VRLESDIDGAALVEADPEQLHRILVNLLRNAREAVDGAAGGKGSGRSRPACERTDRRASSG